MASSERSVEGFPGRPDMKRQAAKDRTPAVTIQGPTGLGLSHSFQELIADPWYDGNSTLGNRRRIEFGDIPLNPKM